MRTATQTVWLTALLLAACGEEGGRTTNEDCQEPAFDQAEVPDPPDYMTCGCAIAPGYDSPWKEACLAEEGYACIADRPGGTCMRKCQQDNECPPHPERQYGVCDTRLGLCIVACADAPCPDEMTCYDAGGDNLPRCVHDFTPTDGG